MTIEMFMPGSVNCTVNFPSSWDELTPSELLVISHHQLSKYKNLAEQQLAIFMEILQLRCRNLKEYLPENFRSLIKPEDAAIKAIDLTEFLYRKNSLTKQLFPVVKLPGIFRKKVYGPEDSFNNMICGEFEDAEYFFNEFLENPDAAPLAHLAAILWRPKGTPYIQYNPRTATYKTYEHEKRLKHFLKLPAPQLYAFFIWYAGCRNTFPELFPTVYEPDPNKEKSTETDLMAFTKCIHAGAGPKNGTRDKVRMLQVKEFFMDMELEAIKIKELSPHGNN